MRKWIALLLTLTLLLGLCACGATNNDLSQDKLKGTWSINITMNELLALYSQEITGAIGFGDLSCLIGSLDSAYTIPFLLVFDGQSTATAYLDKETFNYRMLEFSQYLLNESVLLRILKLQNATAEEIDTALGGLSIARLIEILQLQFQSADFATNLAQHCGYQSTEQYLIIPIASNCSIDGNRVMISNGYMDYDGTNLLLTENENLSTIGFNLKTSPLTFSKVSDQTAY